MISLCKVILCGGVGSRLWPLSRKKFPKQFHNIYSDKSLIEETYLRTLFKYSHEAEKNMTIFVTNNDYINILNKFLDNPKDSKFILEPFGRNTAPAILLSCLYNKLEFEQDDPIFIVLSSDHIFDNDTFYKSIEASIDLAKDNKIVTLGIKPTYPETGYGYIKKDNNSSKILEFVEKPNEFKAKKYLEDGNYFWNSGTFIFKRETLINEFKKYMPEMFKNCMDLIKNSSINKDSLILNPQIFKTLENISIDYAIMEKTNIGHCIIYNGLWNDVGSWKVLFDINKKDNNNNYISGDVVIEKTYNSYIRSDVGLTAVIGLENIVVVKSEDSVLIANKNCCQDVKQIIDKLGDHPIVNEFRTDYRPWGYYKSIDGNDNGPYKVKHIVVYPNKRLSLQSHKFRSEHWVIIKGSALAQKGDKLITLQKDQSIFIEKGELHRIQNIGEDNMEFIETQIGDYLGEDDIVRYEDDFGRN